MLKQIFVIIYPLTILRHKVGGTKWHLGGHAPSTPLPITKHCDFTETVLWYYHSAWVSCE